MKIIALDLAFRTGFACGVAGEKPRLESWRLKRPDDPMEVGVRNLGCTLRDNIQLERPDLIVVEHWLHPTASRSADATISQMHMHGAVEGLAGCYGITTAKPTPAQFRKHFCGVSSAAEPRRRGAPRTMYERNRDRDRTNTMVVNRAIALGYLPRGSTDWDKASAAGLYDYGCATYARKAPKRLVMFGEELVSN